MDNGDEIYRQGKVSNHVFGLIEGQVDIHLGSSVPGEDLVYPFSAPARWYGLSEVVAGVPAFGNAFAGRRSLVFAVGRRKLMAFLEDHPEGYHPIIAHEFALRRDIQETFVDLVTSDGLELVARRLTRLMEFEGAEKNAAFRISQFELAKALGVSPPTVQRAFRELKKYGAIETSYGQVTVRNVARLRDFVSGGSD